MRPKIKVWCQACKDWHEEHLFCLPWRKDCVRANIPLPKLVWKVEGSCKGEGEGFVARSLGEHPRHGTLYAFLQPYWTEGAVFEFKGRKWKVTKNILIKGDVQVPSRCVFEAEEVRS